MSKIDELTVSVNAVLDDNAQNIIINTSELLEAYKNMQSRVPNITKNYDKAEDEKVSSIIFYKNIGDAIDILKKIANTAEYIETHFGINKSFIRFKQVFLDNEIIVNKGDCLIEYCKCLEKVIPEVPIYKVVNEDYIKENIVEAEV